MIIYFLLVVILATIVTMGLFVLGEALWQHRTRNVIMADEATDDRLNASENRGQ